MAPGVGPPGAAAPRRLVAVAQEDEPLAAAALRLLVAAAQEDEPPEGATRSLQSLNRSSCRSIGRQKSKSKLRQGKQPNWQPRKSSLRQHSGGASAVAVAGVAVVEPPTALAAVVRQAAGLVELQRAVVPAN